ncbi:hypothetical protein N0V94_001206 [Neodidymelliopsis sp. IMI 364377]|nr:hypothetical protein N0V94_001206 [Neodidymelliopsis sp. IMI 364377]
MKTTTTAILFLSALVSTTIATPIATPLQARYNHIQLTQRAPTSNSTTSATGTSTLTVKEGDTLSSIAASTGVGICDLAKANGIADLDLILAGMMLTIPAAGAAKKDDTSCLKGAAAAA